MISDQERQLLLEHEPNTRFHIDNAAEKLLTQGRQSRVSVLEYERNGTTRRVLWKRMGVGKGLNKTEARSMNVRLQAYRDALIYAGWNVPKVMYTCVCELSGEYQIFSYEQYISGGDGERLMQNRKEPNFRKWLLVDEIVRTLYRYPSHALVRSKISGQELTRLPHGLDLKLANVVLEPGTDDLYFVDLFGPKELTDNGSWLTYSTKLDSLSEDSLLSVAATREGAILRCWRLAEDQWSGTANVDQLRAEFLSHLLDLDIPAAEFDFIADQITTGYPWLDAIYREREV